MQGDHNIVEDCPPFQLTNPSSQYQHKVSSMSAGISTNMSQYFFHHDSSLLEMNIEYILHKT